MRKILELTPEHFVTGIAPGANVQGKGLFHKANGITVFRDPFLESTQLGLLQAAPSPTDITASVVTDVPWAWLTDVTGSSNRFMYIWGNAGHLYKIDLNGDNNPTDVSTGAAVSNPANGLLIMQAAGGTKYVLYFQTTQIGRWDPTAAWATRTSNWKTGLQSSSWHPTHKFQDRGYYGNGRYIGYVYDNGASDIDVVSDALDIEADERVNCISDDGVYLVAGLTKNTYSDNTTRAQSRIIFWDTNQSSWQREWPIPDASILSIKRVGTAMHAVTSRGVFVFTFDSPPEPLLPYLTSASAPDSQYPSQNAADVLGGALLWGGDARISSFGKIVPQLPNAFFQPFAGFTGTVTMVAAGVKTSQLIVGTSSSKLYRVEYTGAGQTGVSAETIFFDLGRWWQIGKIVLTFGRQIESGDAVSVQLQHDPTVSFSTAQTASYATHGAIRTKEIYTSYEARNLKFILNFVTGAVRVQSIQIWGDPIETPTHTRA